MELLLPTIIILIKILGLTLVTIMNKEQDQMIVPVIMAVNTRIVLYHLLVMIITMNQLGHGVKRRSVLIQLVKVVTSYMPMISSGMIRTVLDLRLLVVHLPRCHGL